MKPDITDCSLSDLNKIKMLLRYIDRLEAVALLARDELVFGGNWVVARDQINKVMFKEDD